MRRFARYSSKLIQRSIFVLTALVATAVLLIPSTPTTTSTGILRRSAALRQNQVKTRDNKCTRCSPPGDQLIYIPLIDLPEAGGGEIVFKFTEP